MTVDIVDRARARGITRICHFTKSANLAGILVSREIRDVATLRSETGGFRSSDDQRLDGHINCVNCTVEYPNGWYLSNAAGRDPNFREWAVLTIDLEMLATPGVLFCPYNAARNKGKAAKPGLDAFESMFAGTVRDQARRPAHPSWWPTDDQAEVLIPGPIPLSRVRSIIFKDQGQAELELYRLEHLGMVALGSLPTVHTAPLLFDKRELSASVRGGRRPIEASYGPTSSKAE